MPILTVTCNSDDTALVTQIQLSVDASILSDYTYTKSTNKITIAARASSTDITLGTFENSLNEIGLWSKKNIARMGPTTGTIDQYQTVGSVESTDSTVFSFVVNGITVSYAYTHSTQLLNIGSHSSVDISYTTFRQLLRFFSFMANNIRETKTIL